MRRFGPNRTALHFRRSKKQAEGAEGEGDEPQKYRLEEGDGTSHAQRIVRELYLRYEKQLQRWKDYRALFVFLGFIALFLAVLYLQREASTAYKVYDTIQPVVVPVDDTMQDAQGVYDWLQNLLQDVWKDPVCGDGLCEAPFEFASYSRFGCRADCGRLYEIQNLTKIQVDIYYDFSHPVGSIPASDLMQQAKWNLCPLRTQYSGACYFEDDNVFERLQGEQHTFIEDAPDGDWDLVVRRDIFNKVRGAVRDTTLVFASGYFVKIYIAAAAAMAEQDFEGTLLQQAINVTNMDFWTYANTTINGSATYPNATEYDAARDMVRAATCYCDGYTNITDPANYYFNDTNAFLNQSVSYDNLNATFAMSLAQYKLDRFYCPRTFAPKVWQVGNDSFGNWTKTLVDVDTANLTAVADFCNQGLNTSITWRTTMTSSVQRTLIEQRLGDTKTTGKFAIRKQVNDAMFAYLKAQLPELLDPVYNNPKGSVPLEDPINAKLDFLIPLYVDGIKYQTEPQRAAVALLRRPVYNTTITLLDLRTRSYARLAELEEIRDDLNAINVPTPFPVDYQAGGQTYHFDNRTVLDLWKTFKAGNATNRTVPHPANLPLPLTVVYNLTSWLGNTTAYMRCDLDNRGADYVGECVAMNNTCASNTGAGSDMVPYNCTNMLVEPPVAITGSLSVADYRLNCETPCDRRLDCNALCECYGTCGKYEFCECKACEDLRYNAAREPQFVDIKSIVEDQAAADASIADIGVDGTVSHRRSRRQLQQSDISAQLNNVLTQVSGVSTQQSLITAQMTSLKAQVDRANTLAETRANDKQLESLIKAGQATIEQGQARMESKLDEIIGKQNQALAAADDAAKSLKAIASLADRQLAAQKALEAAVMQQLSAIKTATYQRIISITQALALFKRARRDKALTYKAAKLANIPCTNAAVVDNAFALNNGNAIDNSTSRERNIGLNNRVIAGMLLHVTRTNETLCPQSKFDKIQRTCTGPLTVASYGVDPVFKRGTTSYNPDFDDVDGTAVVGFYNCSDLLPAVQPTYDVKFLNQTVNAAPYCAELYNPQDLPYAFHFFKLQDKTDGFPIWFDINLSEEGAQDWFTWVNEGLYLDQRTREMTAELVTYNAPLRIFGYFWIRFYFSDGGSIKITHRLNTARVELYNSYEDDVRFAFEIILSIWIFVLMLMNLWEIAYTQKTKGNFLKYFLRGWNWVMFCSNGLLTACMIIWWVIATQYADEFDMAIRYNVYADLSPDAHFTALVGSGENLTAASNDINQLKELIDMFNWYFALNGINILLLIARMLKLMDFQPRLGVVTRSLWLAGPDLIHFAIVFGMVFIGYAMMGHLIFGNAIPEFATFSDSINTCFEILLGNIDVNEQLRALGGLQEVAGALFFWSYELLVYMVLLNFLLAIIVDAFAEVKEKTSETVGIHTELYTLLRDKWRSLMGRCTSNYISDAKLGVLLRQWAGEDKDDEAAAAAAEEKRKLLTVLNEDLDEETLKEVLRECLRDAPADGPDKTKQAGLLARCIGRLGGKGGKVGGAGGDTDAEVVQAAHYIVERFGAVPKPYEDGEELMPEAQAPMGAMVAGGVAGGAGREVALEKERDQLAQALERLAEVQRELAEGQRNLMAGQKQLADQQGKLVQLMNEQGPSA